jgi:hypothetical protein
MSNIKGLVQMVVCPLRSRLDVDLRDPPERVKLQIWMAGGSATAEADQRRLRSDDHRWRLFESRA